MALATIPPPEDLREPPARGRSGDSGYGLTHARHDRAMCLAPGLLRSLQRGERAKSKLDITYSYGQESIRFFGPEPLGVDDARVLLVLIAAAGPDGLLLGPEAETEIGVKLRAKLGAGGENSRRDGIHIRSNFSKLLREINKTDSGTSIAGFRESLRRLAATTVIARQGQKEASSRLLSYDFDDDSGEVCVALNPRIAAAIVGDNSYTRIDLKDIRALAGKSDASTLIYLRLCAWVNPGTQRRVEIDTLCAYIWPNKASDGATRKRHQRVKIALDDLRALGWKIVQYSAGKFEIGRPALPGADQAQDQVQAQAQVQEKKVAVPVRHPGRPAAPPPKPSGTLAPLPILVRPS